MYADTMTVLWSERSARQTPTLYSRSLQPRTRHYPRKYQKAIGKGIERSQPKEEKPKLNLNKIPKDEYAHLVKDLSAQMNLASANLEFEKAAELRDLIEEIKANM